MFLEISQNSQEHTCARVPATLLKKRLWHRCFPVNFVKFLRTLIFTEHLWWLLLIMLCFSFSCHRGAFRIQSNIYDWAFLEKQLTAKSPVNHLQKSFIVDARLVSKNASLLNLILLCGLGLVCLSAPLTSVKSK